MSFENVRELFIARSSNTLVAENLLSFNEINDKIWDLKADVFLPCAASRLITEDQLERLIRAGLEVISCGANVPFADEQIFYGPIAGKADEKLSLIPDFIANCGMARVFAYLMSNGDVDLTDEGIFSDTSECIYQALEKIHKQNHSKQGLTKTAFGIALEKLI